MGLKYLLKFNTPFLQVKIFCVCIQVTGVGINSTHIIALM